MYTLQIIRQCFADEPSLLFEPRNQAFLAKANATIQSLVDFTLETVPFHIGDTVVPTNPMYSEEIDFPCAFVTSPQTGLTEQIPDFSGVYKDRAAASGGWTIFPHLVDIYRLAEPEKDAVPMVLRDGQLEWIKGQVKRLQTIFLFCDPVW